MESFLEFGPPQLPQLMTPDLLLTRMQSLYPEVQGPSDLLRSMGAALAVFEQARVECETRHQHFGALRSLAKNLRAIVASNLAPKQLKILPPEA